MSSTSSAIKGGAAYVQAFLDDNPLVQGLAQLQTKLKTWQAGLSKMGARAYGGELPEPFAALARFAASPAGAFTALLGAAEHTATAREEMLRMSEATGVAIDKFSALAYAARRAGVSNEALASGLKRMEGKEFMSQMQAGRGGGLRGVTNAAFAKMGQGDAADKLREFIKMTENMPSEEKIGLARRMGLSELLPLINQGIDSLDAFTARAKDLGLVVSEKDAKAGKQFTIALGDLHDVLMSSVQAIGGALVPMLTGLTNILVKGSVVIRDWIKNHKALTIAIFASVGVIVAGGIALKVMAIGAGLTSTALGILSGAFSIVTGTAAAFSAVLNSSLLPFGLLGAAIVAFVGYAGYLSGAFDGLGKQWSEFASETSSSISSIANAIGKGDFKEAWAVTMAWMKLEWQRLYGVLSEQWEEFKLFFQNSTPYLALTMVEVTAKIKSIWNELFGWLAKKWLEFQNTTVAQFAPLLSTISGPLGLALTAARNRAGNKTPEEIDADTIARNAEIEKNRKDAADVLKNDIDRGRNSPERDARIKAQEDELKRLQDALKAAQAAANLPGKDLIGGNKKSNEAFNAAQSSEHRGTFSGAVAAMLGGPDVQQQQLNRLENIEKALGDWLNLGGDMIDQDGKLLDAVMSMNAVQ